MRKYNTVIIILVVALLASFYYIIQLQPLITASCSDKYPFINEDLNCDADPTTQTFSIKQKILTEIDVLFVSKKADRISVFYRDLVNRQWFGINENEVFEPGSLFKLPIAIAYFKLAELDPSILDIKYKYVSINTDNLYPIHYTKPEKIMESGKIYKNIELILQMIRYSDNAPVSMLVEGLNESFFQKVYLDLGLYIPTVDKKEQNFVSVKTYGVILRTLFNGSYLNQSFSNKLLEIMGQSAFKSGIVSGVPNNVTVSNKFGERITTDSRTLKINNVQLHDCGIIYVPKKPYVLCVMTQGKDYNTLVDIISKISKDIYNNR